MHRRAQKAEGERDRLKSRQVRFDLWFQRFNEDRGTIIRLRREVERHRRNADPLTRIIALGKQFPDGGKVAQEQPHD